MNNKGHFGMQQKDIMRKKPLSPIISISKKETNEYLELITFNLYKVLVSLNFP